MARRLIGRLTVGLIAAGALLTATLSWAGAAEPPSPATIAAKKQAELGSGGKGIESKRTPAGKVPPKAAVVRVGALINDIQQIDLQSHSYNVDMYFWFKWKDPGITPPNSFEFMNAFQLWGHILTYTTNEPQRLPDGSYYQVLRNQGQFNTKLPLGRYPFDTQHLRVQIEDSDHGVTQLVFVPDGPNPVRLSRGISVPGWKIGDPEMRIVNNTYNTDFGDPRAKNPTYSRVVIDLPITRPYGTYALKLLLPLLLVALTAALALWVHPRYVEGRIGIGITALLTLVALQLTSNQSLPEVNYLLLLDKLYILSYAFVVLTLVAIARNSWVDATGDMTAAVKADRRGLLVIGALYLLATGLLFLISLT